MESVNTSGSEPKIPAVPLPWCTSTSTMRAFLSSPSFGIFDPKTNKWIAENTGVDPDIEVDARPDLVAKGRDPQLEKAVEYLLDQLKKSPPKKKISAPEFPRVR